MELPAPSRSPAGSGAFRVKIHAMTGGGRQKMAAIAPFFVSRALRFASQVGKTGQEAAQVKDGLARHKKTGCDRLPVPMWTAGVQVFPQLC
jgi:hypothetical protein